MKLSFSTLGCPDWSFQTIIENASRMGYEGLEIRGIENEMDVSKIPYFKPENWPETAKKLEAHGLQIMNLGTSASFHDEARWEAALKEAKTAIDVAQQIGVPYIRLFGDALPDPEKRDETLQRIAKGWTEVYRYSEGKGVTPLVEVHGQFNNVEVYKEIFKYFNHPKFAVVWDIEHSYKVYERDFVEFFGFIRKYVRHVHIKDTKKVDGQWKLQNIGEGEIPIPLHVRLLAATNYDGFLSLEWEKKWHPELADCSEVFPWYVTYMRKILY